MYIDSVVFFSVHKLHTLRESDFRYWRQYHTSFLVIRALEMRNIWALDILNLCTIHICYVDISWR